MTGSGVFISYRRQDAQSAAGRLADSLERRFGKQQIFRDVETIEPGVDFVDAIDKALSACQVMVAVIGRRWLGNVDEVNRLHQPNDWIRLEIAAALKRGIRVIPVLVEGASPPADGDLPDDLKSLARRQAQVLADERWEYDVQQLAVALENAGVRPAPTPVGPPPMPPQAQSSKLVRALAWIGGIVLVLMIIGVATESANRNDVVSPGPVQPAGLASGAPTSACGCWGYANFGASRPSAACASGMEVAVACPAYCPGGGYQWQSKCM
jgi:hypothetical protein